MVQKKYNVCISWPRAETWREMKSTLAFAFGTCPRVVIPVGGSRQGQVLSRCLAPGKTSDQVVGTPLHRRPAELFFLQDPIRRTFEAVLQGQAERGLRTRTYGPNKRQAWQSVRERGPSPHSSSTAVVTICDYPAIRQFKNQQLRPPRRGVGTRGRRLMAHLQHDVLIC